jgi:hypothetical protein
LNSYEKYLEEYPDYKKLINALGLHYFGNNDSETSLVFDDFKINELLETEDSRTLIKDEIINFLSKNKTINLDLEKDKFLEIRNLYKLWKLNGSDGYPPHLPIIVFFIVVAGEMGGNYNFNNYYDPLLESLFLKEKSKNDLIKSFTNTFSNNGNLKLFSELNSWAELNKIRTDFREGSTHNIRNIGWVTSQGLFNQKDLYVLTSFFQKMQLNPSDMPNIEVFKNRLVVDLYQFTKESSWTSKFSKNLKRNLETAVNNKTDLLLVISEVLLKQLSKWDGVELSSDGIRTITSRLAFAEPDPKLGFEFICNLVTTNLITEQSDQAAERIITEEDEAIEDVVFKRDIYEDFWYLLLEDFGNQDVSYRLKNYRINISILEKPIKVFTNEKSGFHNFSNMWVELRDNEKPDSINSYSIVCQSSTQKIVIDYLRKYSSGEHTYIEFNDYCVFLNVTFLENREPQNNELKVLNSIKDDSYRISFYGGLEVRNGVYIKDHLPLLIIPKEYVHQKYRLFINESELELESKLLNIFEIDLNNAGIDFTKKNGEVSIKVVKEDIVIDTKQINYQDFPATEYLHNSLENDLLAYDIELGQKNEMNFLNIIPKRIKSEELKDGYISGGYIKVTSEYRIPKSKFEKETINTNWNFINFIGNKEGSKKRIITTTNNFGGNRFKFINNLENLNKLFTSENLIPVFNTNIGDDLNRFINSEIPFSDSKAVWIIYEINGRKKIKQIDSALPTPYEAQTSKASLNQDSFNKITKRNLDWRQLIINTDKDLKKNNDSNADNELWKKYVKFAESIKL